MCGKLAIHTPNLARREQSKTGRPTWITVFSFRQDITNSFKHGSEPEEKAGKRRPYWSGEGKFLGSVSTEPELFKIASRDRKFPSMIEILVLENPKMPWMIRQVKVERVVARMTRAGKVKENARRMKPPPARTRRTHM